MTTGTPLTPLDAVTLEIVDADTVMALVTQADAIAVTRRLFVDLEEGCARSFAGARGHGSDATTRFGTKLGYDGSRRVPGLKVGSFWPANMARSLRSHGSTTLLLDDATGFPFALVEATHLNALRTAASDAVAVDVLARADAAVLTVVGTGNQARHEAIAISLVRTLRETRIAGRDPAKAEALAADLRSLGLPAVACSDLRAALAGADIVCTATSACAPLFDAAWIEAGVHISAMGADGPGKQELPPALAQRGLLFADLPAQSIEIGEFQHFDAAHVRSIGSVLTRVAPGREREEDITIYDSSGIGLQDIAIAALALDRARRVGRTIKVRLR